MEPAVENNGSEEEEDVGGTFLVNVAEAEGKVGAFSLSLNDDESSSNSSCCAF